MDKPNTRSHETSIEIRATPAEIWKTITEAEEIARWFAPEASVTPGEGGKMTISWGGGMEITHNISTWEPNQHLRTEAETPRAPSAAPESLALLAVDYYIQAKDGGTAVLRVVQSGYPNDAAWDGEFDGTKHGWQLFLLVLKHAIEVHKGKKSFHASLYEPFAGEGRTQQSAWTHLHDQGLPMMGPLSIMAGREPHEILVISKDWNDAVVWFTVSKSYIAASLITYGIEEPAFESAKEQVQSVLGNVAGKAEAEKAPVS